MQARGPSVEVLVDCPNCRVEGARVEIVVRGDHLAEASARREDHAVSGRCRMCGAADEGGRVLSAGARAWDETSVRAALASWAAEEGETDVAAFVRANFGERDLEGIVRKLVAGERVATSFEVVAWLFGGRGAVAGMTPDAGQAHVVGSHSVAGHGDGEASGEVGGADTTAGEALRRARRHRWSRRDLRWRAWGGSVRLKATPRQARRATDPAPGGRHPVATARGRQPPPPQESPLEARRRDATRALCAARAADGRQHPAEDPVFAEALTALDVPVPAPADERVWRPNELRRAPDPAGTLRWMRAIALADGEADPSEVRLLEAYARAWQVPLDAIAVAEAPWSTRLAQAWRKWRSS